MNNRSLPFFSIVMPTYNHSEYIGKALQSVIDQNFKNWEILVIDNHSTDNTKQVLSKFSDPRIKYLKIHNNGIIAKSRNLGIKLAKGEWIAFLDSDDWWSNDKLENCYSNINDEVDFIYHILEVKDYKTKFFKRKNYKGRKLYNPILNDLLIGVISKGNAIGNSSVVLRKDIIIKVGGISENTNLVASEDYNTWLKIAQITNKFKFINKKLGSYLVHDASSQKKDLSLPHKEAVKDFMHLLNDEQKLNLEVKLKYMSGCYRDQNKNYIKAKEYFMFVFKNGSFNLKIRSLLKIILIMFK